MAKTVVGDPTTAGREVADLAIEHGDGDWCVLDEGAKLALTGAQLFLGAFALGNVGGEAENIMRSARCVAHEGEFHVCPNQAAIPEEIALVDVEMIDLAGDQPLKRVQIRLDVIRVSEFVKHAERTQLVGSAAEHAPVSWVNSGVTVFNLADRDAKFSAFKHGAEFLFAFTDGAFIGTALRDVQKGDDRTDGLPASEKRMGPVFDGEAGAITAPEDFVIGMRAFAGAIPMNNAAVLHRERSAIGVGMMEEQVAV
jgi:hypothetical protein